MPRSQCEKDNVQLVQELAEVDGPFESPINLNFRALIKLELPSLTWNKPDAVPKKMKITNTGHTVIISGKWKSERPYLTGGPLDGKYVFSQIHFHWGPDNCKGSEHQVSGESFPLEMHVAHFKTEYMTQEAALREKDGMLQEEPNNSLKKIIHALPSIRQANISQPMENRSILALCNPFTDDYFMYWGSVVTSTCAHILLWIVCREPFGISRDQVDEFRKTLDSSQRPIRRNNREPQPLHKRNVFHVNASRHMDEPMLPIKQIMGCFCDRSTADPERDDSHKSEGDGGCGCNAKCGPQEELEGRQNSDWNYQTGVSRGADIGMQQTVYYEHSTVHSLPTLPRDFGDSFGEPEETERKTILREGRQISQSCCFLSIKEDKSVREERQKDRRRKPIDSVMTLTNLIETLETLKMQTYKKLKEIETINCEIRGMKSSCENLQEKNCKKIISRQKRFTIRSSQCCFSEMRKLAKDYNFDRLLDDKLIAGAGEGKTILLSTTEATDSAFLCSNASGDKAEFTGHNNISSRPLNAYDSEGFTRKAQQLIRSFFEDIKESEETQVNLEKNCILKNFEKLSRRRSDQSTVSSTNIQTGHVQITKKMMNTGRIRNRFFTEIPSDEKVILPSEAKLIPTGKKRKKKSRSFFKIRLGGFENDRAVPNKKVQKRPLFTRSALAWLNSRFSTINDSGPFISLRLKDIEPKSGIISSKKSKQSLKNSSMRRVISNEHVPTDVSSYKSGSFSEISCKQSCPGRSRTRVRKNTNKIENDLKTSRKSDISLLKFVKDLEANKFFIQMGRSTNMSSATSTDTERRNKKFRNRKSRKDLWEKYSSGIFRKEDSKTVMDKEKEEDGKVMSESGADKRASISTDSNSTIRQPSKQDVILSCQSSKSEMEKLKEVGINGTETQTVNSPRRKKLKLEGGRSHDSEPDSNRSEIEAIKIEPYKASYVESECQANLRVKLDEEGPAPSRSRDNVIPSSDATPKTSVEKYDCRTDLGLPSISANETESQTETEKELTENSEVQPMRGISFEVNVPPPVLFENTLGKDGELEKYIVRGNEASEASLSPRRSSDTMSESKDFYMESKQKEYWMSKLPKKEYSPSRVLVVETQTRDLVVLGELIKGKESCLSVDTERAPQSDMLPKSSELTYIGTNLLSEESPDRKKDLSDSTQKESEFTNFFPAEEIDKSLEASCDVSQNELSECNEYDLQTDSNGTMVYNVEKEIQSRDSTPSIPSSEDGKHRDTSAATASSVVNILSQQKPFSADSLNSYKNMYASKHRKRRQCIRKKSKPIVRKSNAMMRKLNKIGGSNLDFTNLTEEEQLKIISANVAKFVKQKLVEHKHFFDFGKSETVNFDVEEWSKSAELELSEIAHDLEDDMKWGKQVEEVKEQPEETEMISQSLMPATSVSAPPLSLPTPMMEEAREELEERKLFTVLESAVLSPAGDGEKLDKNELRRQTLDFVKLNKIMAGKYKRRTPQETSMSKFIAKKLVKKDEKKEMPKAPIINPHPDESPKVDIPKPRTLKPVQGSLIGRGVRAPSVDSARRGTSLQRSGKSDIPVLQNRQPSRSPRATRSNARSSSASPTAEMTTSRTTPTPLAALQKPKLPKKLPIPIYTLTSYLPAPSEVIECQQRELDKYLTQTNNINDFFLDESKEKKHRGKKTWDLSQKNLDYLIMLQKRINHEMSANIENSMNYVQTLLSQDYNGSAIIEKAPVKNSLDVFEPGTGGIVLIEMNDQFDCSSSSSEFSEESGFYCIYRGRNGREKNRNMKQEIIIKRNESGDSGLVDSRLFEELHETDSSYGCEVSVLVTPEEENFGQTDDVPGMLEKYIYHLGGGEESKSCYIPIDALIQDESINPKAQLKKRRNRVLDLPKETKRELLDVLEEEMKELTPPPGIGGEHTLDLEKESTPEDLTTEVNELETIEMITKISEMVKLYLNKYDTAQDSDCGQEEGEDGDEESSETFP